MLIFDIKINDDKWKIIHVLLSLNQQFFGWSKEASKG